MAPGPGASWVWSLLSLALTLSLPWALLLVRGTCPSCREMEQGAPWTGSCPISCVEP